MLPAAPYWGLSPQRRHLLWELKCDLLVHGPHGWAEMILTDAIYVAKQKEDCTPTGQQPSKSPGDTRAGRCRAGASGTAGRCETAAEWFLRDSPRRTPEPSSHPGGCLSGPRPVFTGVLLPRPQVETPGRPTAEWTNKNASGPTKGHDSFRLEKEGDSDTAAVWLNLKSLCEVKQASHKTVSSIPFLRCRDQSSSERENKVTAGRGGGWGSGSGGGGGTGSRRKGGMGTKFQ